MAFGTFKGSLTGTAASILASNAITGSVAVAIGDLVFVVVAEQTALTANAASDNLGNTYTAQNAGTLSGATISGRAYWSRVTVAGTLTTVTVTATASANDFAGTAAVIEGPFALSPIDANPANITTDVTSPFTCPPTGTLAQSVEVVMAWGARNSNSAWAATSPNLLALDNATSAACAVALGRQVVNATTTVTPAFTAAANPTNDVLGTASFRAALLPMGWMPLNEQPMRVRRFAGFGDGPNSFLPIPIPRAPGQGWETQPAQPPRPRWAGKAAMLPGPRSDFSPIIKPPDGWENQAWQPPRFRGKAPAIFFVSGFAAFATPPQGWENQAWQPFRTRRVIGTTPVNPDDVFVPAVATTPAWQFSTQEFQPPGARVRQRGAAFPDDVADFNDQTPLVNFYPAGWEIQAVQPPHRRPERFGAFAPREDGIERPFTNFYPMGWEVQPPQPPSSPLPRLRAAGTMRGDDGIYRQYAAWLNFEWGAQNFQPPHSLVAGREAATIGPVNVDAVFVAPIVVLPFGWEIQSPPPPRFPSANRRAGALAAKEDGIEASFSVWYNAGWEVQSPQPPHPRPEQRFAALAPRDDGTQFPLLRFFDFGFENQPPQPPHRRPERAGAIMRGDDGNEATFIIIALAPWGYEQPYLFPRYPVPRRAAALAGAENIPAVMRRFFPMGWEPTPPIFRRPRLERAGAIMAGDTGTASPLVRVVPPWGYEPPAFAGRRAIARAGALAARAEGTDAPFQFFRPMGREPSEPIRRPPLARGGALAGATWQADRMVITGLAGLDWALPEMLYRRRRPGAALLLEGGWFLPRFVNVFYASTILTRAGAAPEVSQASGQTVTTAATGQTVVKGEQRGQ